jgi:hypothetical protein
MPPFFFTIFLTMKNGLLILLFALCVASTALTQTATTPKGSPATKKKSAPTKAAAGKAVSVKPASTLTKPASPNAASAKSVSARKGRSSSKRTVKPGTAVRSTRQMTPTPDRYRDIQQALVEKGYLKSEPNGVWDTQSSDALRQFQTDQKLTPTGKISSASLISLGLGPKTAAGAPNAAPAPAANGPAPAANPEAIQTEN